jgi:hypothetical protein
MGILLKLWWQHMVEYKFEIILFGSMQIINIMFFQNCILSYGLIFILTFISFISLYLARCLYSLNIEDMCDFQRKFSEELNQLNYPSEIFKVDTRERT